MLATGEHVVPPLIRLRDRLGKEFGRKQERVASSHECANRVAGRDEVFGNFEGSDEREAALTLGRIEADCVVVCGIVVRPTKIEAFVSHEPNEEPMPTTVIQECTCGVSMCLDDRCSLLRKLDIPLNSADIRRGKSGGIRFVQPVGLFRLNRTAHNATIVSDIVAAKDSGRREIRGVSAANSAGNPWFGHAPIVEPKLRNR